MKNKYEKRKEEIGIECSVVSPSERADISRAVAELLSIRDIFIGADEIHNRNRTTIVIQDKAPSTPPATSSSLSSSLYLSHHHHHLRRALRRPGEHAGGGDGGERDRERKRERRTSPEVLMVLRERGDLSPESMPEEREEEREIVAGRERSDGGRRRWREPEE
ncbi:hypothetical protein LguiA_023775 [Lonicera macranthoides]